MKIHLLLRLVRISRCCKRFAGVILDLMYTCICNAIRESDLRAAAARSDGDAVAVYAALGKAPNCGQCLEKAQKTIEEERALVASLDPARKLCEEVAL